MELYIILLIILYILINYQIFIFSASFPHALNLFWGVQLQSFKTSKLHFLNLEAKFAQ